MRYFLTLLICLCFSSAWAFNPLILLSGSPPAAPTCSDGIQNGDETGVDCGGSCPACPSGGKTYSDTFEVNTIGTDWIADSGSANIFSSQLIISGGTWVENSVIYQHNLDTANGYMLATITADAITYPGFIFRYSNSTSNHYALFFWVTDDQVTFTTATSASDGGTVDSTQSITVNTGDKFGITWTGTGTNVVIRIWRNPIGTAPDSVSSWGSASPSLTITDDPSHVSDTGLRVGFAGEQSSSEAISYSAFYTGDL